MEMFYLIVVSAMIITILAVSAWTWPALAQEAEPSADPKPEPEASAPRQSLEGVLVTQLMAGEISTAQYRRAVEGLAARDEDRHPMAVPPENGTADA
ncbi:hypothetical protein BJ973_002882 [Actinoplanes tereljensis]|uniref:SHOCT domain-containing protein n=1 Tax=Paractinoplanes tereljensis TaxID=571912 RepID=A0A919NR93_9ACTN|nr:hypothetical protein [Actinoplanes tereljensis]GIF22559.1 hypothetical protein Ate02nite_52890 [Actinoplanes tereljensis]